MPRPPRCRCISCPPGSTYFKPRGVPMRQLKEIKLNLDELEALKLADYQGLGQIKAAKKMEISQSTFQRILASARQKVAHGLVEGQAIQIEGGVVKVRSGLKRLVSRKGLS